AAGRPRHGRRPGRARGLGRRRQGRRTAGRHGRGARAGPRAGRRGPRPARAGRAPGDNPDRGRGGVAQRGRGRRAASLRDPEAARLIEAQTLAEAAITEIKEAPDLGALERIRLDYLGRGSGRISALLESIGNLPKEQRPGAGKAANEAKRAVESALEARAAELELGRLADLA